MNFELQVVIRCNHCGGSAVTTAYPSTESESAGCGCCSRDTGRLIVEDDDVVVPEGWIRGPHHHRRGFFCPEHVSKA